MSPSIPASTTTLAIHFTARTARDDSTYPGQSAVYSDGAALDVLRWIAFRGTRQLVSGVMRMDKFKRGLVGWMLAGFVLFQPEGALV